MNTETLFEKLKQSYSYVGLAENVLRLHADALMSTGLVTDENVSDVVSKQKDYLEGLQKYNDSRVNEAVRKSGEKALKEAEERERKAAEEAAAKAKEEAMKTLPDSVKNYVETIKAQFEADKKASEEARRQAEEAQSAKESEWKSLLEGMKQTIDGFKKENDDLKKANALKERQAAIVAKAKELGIPQYRIDEGFVIPDDADEAAYTATLSTIAQNIKAQQLPTGMGRAIVKADVSKEEVDDIAKNMVAKL